MSNSRKLAQENLVQERDTEIAEIQKQLYEVRYQLEDVQQQKTRQEQLVQKRDTQIAEIQKQLYEVRYQLEDVQQLKTSTKNWYSTSTTGSSLEVAGQLHTLTRPLNDSLITPPGVERTCTEILEPRAALGSQISANYPLQSEISSGSERQTVTHTTTPAQTASTPDSDSLMFGTHTQLLAKRMQSGDARGVANRQ